MEENGLYPDSQDTFGQQSIGAYKLGTAIRVSEELLNDSAFDVETYIATNCASYRNEGRRSLPHW